MRLPCSNTHVFDGQIPVRLQNLEPPLLFLLIRLLIRIHLLDQRRGIEIVMRHCRVFIDDRHAIIPASIFGRVINRHYGGDLQHTPKLHLFFQDGIMILSKERDELVRVAPFCFVVVLNHERFFRRHALRRCPVPQTQNEKGTRQKQPEHQNSPKRSTHKSSSLNPRIVACFDEKGTASARRNKFSGRRASGGLESPPIQEPQAEFPPQSSRIPAYQLYAKPYKTPPHNLPPFPSSATS